MNSKVLIATPCLKLGGTEIQTLNLSKALQSCGHSVEIICYFEYDNSMLPEFNKAGVCVRLLNLNRSLSSFKFILLLAREIRLRRPDVVHVQYMAPGALPIIAARLAGVKTVFATVHQPWTLSHGKFSKFYLRLASMLCTRFLSVSINTEKSWFTNGRLFNENKPLKLQPGHFTIYNSVDVNRIKRIISNVNNELLKSELSIPQDVFIIGAISRLRNEKGIGILIDAFKKLHDEKTPAHLLIVGTGPDEIKLREKVSGNLLDSNITFFGEAEWERAMQLAAIMDIVVVPSRFEGFGLTAAEAQAAGKPAVVSDVFGLKEVVIQEETGFLFQVENAEMLKDLLQVLCKDKNLRNKQGLNGQKRAESVFGMDIFFKKISALYAQV